MKNDEMKAKLDELFKLKDVIQTKVKKIYERHNELTIELAEEFCRRKGGTHSDGILKVPLSIKFKGDKATYSLKPNYMKDGQFRNVMWKPTGVDAFSVEKFEPIQNEE